MNRAYGLLELKSFDDDKRIVEGIATTPSPDRMGDIVEPMGAQFKLPMPLLWQHMSDVPVGEVFYAKPTKSGIPIKARVFKAAQSKTLIERLDEAWETVKLGLIKGFSIGFKPLESAQIEDTFSFRFTAWEWLETSLVTIPANADASIAVVKSISRELLAASGRPHVVQLDEHLLRRVRRETRKGVVYL
jgi:HK97 family phage prohead protease